MSAQRSVRGTGGSPSGSLSKQITRDGFRMIQVRRLGQYAIYRRERLTTGVTHYEAIKILVETKTRKLPSGALRNAGSERYPSSNEWGKYGWTCKTIEEAEAKLRELTARSQK